MVGAVDGYLQNPAYGQGGQTDRSRRGGQDQRCVHLQSVLEHAQKGRIGNGKLGVLGHRERSDGVENLESGRALTLSAGDHGHALAMLKGHVQLLADGPGDAVHVFESVREMQERERLGFGLSEGQRTFAAEGPLAGEESEGHEIRGQQRIQGPCRADGAEDVEDVRAHRAGQESIQKCGDEFVRGQSDAAEPLLIKVRVRFSLGDGREGRIGLDDARDLLQERGLDPVGIGQAQIGAAFARADGCVQPRQKAVSGRFACAERAVRELHAEHLGASASGPGQVVLVGDGVEIACQRMAGGRAA